MLDVVQDGRAVARATLRLVASADAGLLPPASGSLSFRWSLALLAHFLCAAYFPAVVLRRLFPWGFSASALRLCFGLLCSRRVVFVCALSALGFLRVSGALASLRVGADAAAHC